GFLVQCASSMLSRDGFCKTMDSRADGFSRGEGLASVLLGTSLPMNRLTIDSSAINQDGASGGITVPNKLAQEKLLRSCWQHTEKSPSKANVQLHGTGTKLGDPIGYNALTSVFGVSTRLTLGASKTVFGHLEAASGIMGLLNLIVQVRAHETTCHLHYSNANPKLAVRLFDTKVCTLNSRNEEDVAGVSSFGLSGTNSHAIISNRFN
ncbi:MAG: polyketide synthase, partial [Pseudoalteromonas sp.]|nr:polyketide synthase [Pseudoalteromonas sp.]